MEVANKLLAFRKALLDGTIAMAIEAIVDDEVVNVHLYQPFFQGCMVPNIAEDPIAPTTPDAKSKLAKPLKFNPLTICAKSFVPLRKNTDNALTVVDGVKPRAIFLGRKVPVPVIRYADNPL